MITLDLNGKWKIKRTGWDEWLDAKVPGSVFNDLLNAGKIEDPFYRDNEDEAIAVASHDYEYEREFIVEGRLLAHDKIFLCCDGLDTLAEITMNGSPVARTCNMHRRYEFDIKGMIKEGSNRINIILRSPVKFCAEKSSEADLEQGVPYLRKAHHMFGWDWGPKIPDSGIWKDIYINAYNKGRIDDIYVDQCHENRKVSLNIKLGCDKWTEEELSARIKLTSPDGSTVVQEVIIKEYRSDIRMDIENPVLWWPNGFGSQHLYRLEAVLKGAGDILESREMNIGLRVIRVKREKDQSGESFQFEVNGVSIFAMGANYIPEDSLLPRCTPERTERLIRDCADANFNCIRVWGGGFYQQDYFYDMCDRYGLIVWQDLMYSCHTYDLTEEFEENIKCEAEYNVKRLRNHACIGLWCGNNEMEMGWEDFDFPKTQKLREDYLKMFESIFPQIVKDLDPDTFYWPSSPSSGGGINQANGKAGGNSHSWGVWWGKPIESYTEDYSRFVSEFGMQSFSCAGTLEPYILPEDKNLFSYIMEKRQKSPGGNSKIMSYLSQYLKNPRDFESMIYASQITQAIAVKTGVEHWRRIRGICMGTLYWQINDVWPAISWSSIDYAGRWKALHYFAKRLFAPVLLSACTNGTKVELHLSNEQMMPIKGEIEWRLRNNRSAVLREGAVPCEAAPLCSIMSLSLELGDIMASGELSRGTYLEFNFISEKKCISSGVFLFTRDKHFQYLTPNISINASDEGDEFLISLKSKAFARYVELSIKGVDCVFEDNYFDISAGDSKNIVLKKSRISQCLSLEQLSRDISARSIVDME